MSMCKGFLGLDRDWPSSAKAEGSLTARPIRWAVTKVGLSDLTVPSGRPMPHGNCLPKTVHKPVGLDTRLEF